MYPFDYLFHDDNTIFYDEQTMNDIGLNSEKGAEIIKVFLKKYGMDISDSLFQKMKESEKVRKDVYLAVMHTFLNVGKKAPEYVVGALNENPEKAQEISKLFIKVSDIGRASTVRTVTRLLKDYFIDAKYIENAVDESIKKCRADGSKKPLYKVEREVNKHLMNLVRSVY